MAPPLHHQHRTLADRLPYALGLSVLLLLPMLHTAPAHAAATYYVDTNSPNADDGGPGTAEVPFKTITKAVRKMGAPGVTILVEPGVYLDEHVVRPSPYIHGGAPGAPLVIRAAASGVVLDGAENYGHPEWWTAGPGTSWFVDRWTREVDVDGSFLPETTEPVESMPAPSWRRAPMPGGGEGTYVNLGGDNPGSHYVRLGIAGWRQAMTLSDCTYVIVEGFEFRYWGGHGIYLRGGHDIVLRDNHLSYIVNDAIQIDYSVTGYDSVHSVTAERNLVEHCWGHGINVTSGHDHLIQDNELVGDIHLDDSPAGHPLYILPGYRSGIKLERVTRATVRRNRCHDQGESGIFLVQSTGVSLELNLSYANVGHGYQFDRARDNTLNRNVAFGNHGDGVSLEGGASGNRVYDCILTDNGIGANHYDLFVADSSGVGLESNDNLIWNSTSDPPIKYLGVKYAVAGDFAGATGHDTRTFQSDPRFVDPAAGDFHVRPGSDAIDSGNSESPGWPSLDFAAASPMDDPDTPNAGLGPVTFSDRGAFEFMPEHPLAVEDPALSGITLSPPFPNPARGGVSALLKLEHSSPVTWSVLDAQGRRVWAGATTILPAGTARLRWPGVLDSGAPAPASVYIMRVNTGGRSISRRCTLIR